MAGQDVDQEEQDYDARVRAEADQRVGQVLGGKYQVVRALGIGGMGAVYEVEHQLIGKRMALKCLHPEYARDRDLIERFKREARAATAIGNEHIVDVTDMGDLPDGAPFIVMEMLKGQALADLLDKEGALPIGRACKIVRQICFALAAAHEKGIVHRDMKPENVFLALRSESSDFVKVLDFGISKMHEHGKTDRGLTRTGIAMGTPSYMSPEQAQGAKDVDHRTDIWAVGVMLYEMLTLRRPFEADSYPMMLMAIVGRDPEPLKMYRKDVPDALEAVVLKTLVKPMGLRTQTMRELADELLPFLTLTGKPRLTDGTDGASSSAPPPAEDEGTAGTLVAGTSAPPPPAARQATPVTRASPPASEPPAKPAASEREQKTGVMGTADRKTSGPTGEIGVVERRGREATSSGTAVPMRGNQSLLIGVGVVAVLALGAGGLALSGSSDATDTTDHVPPVAAGTTGDGTGTGTGTGAAAASGGATGAGTTGGATGAGSTGAETGAGSVPVAPAAEVQIQIMTTPADAHIEIAGVEFPNPLSAHRPRSLDPLTIRISADGYQTIERLAIFDHDQSFVFQLARGRGVRREGMDGRVHEDHTGHGEAPAGSGTGGTGSSGSGSASGGGTATGGGGETGSGGFREEF